GGVIGVGGFLVGGWVFIFFAQFLVYMLVSRFQQEARSFTDRVARLDGFPFVNLAQHERALVEGVTAGKNITWSSVPEPLLFLQTGELVSSAGGYAVGERSVATLALPAGLA